MDPQSRLRHIAKQSAPVRKHSRAKVPIVRSQSAARAFYDS